MSFRLPFVPPQTADRYDWEPTYGFTKTDRVALAAALEAVRRRTCAYGPLASTCDCKYGLGEAVTSEDPPARVTHPGSETTGCPELRSAIWMLLHGWPVSRTEPTRED